MGRAVGRAWGAALALVLTPALVAGCGSDTPTISSARAKASVTAAGDSLRSAANRPGFREVTEPWRAAVAKVSDPTCGNGDGGSRWRLAGALTVEDPSRDGDSALARLIGSLPGSWHRALSVGDLEDDPVLVLPAVYGEGDDAVAADISVLPTARGWTYSLSARSACTAND